MLRYFTSDYSQNGYLRQSEGQLKAGCTYWRRLEQRNVERTWLKASWLSMSTSTCSLSSVPSHFTSGLSFVSVQPRWSIERCGKCFLRLGNHVGKGKTYPKNVVVQEKPFLRCSNSHVQLRKERNTSNCNIYITARWIGNDFLAFW